jgi:hypothetical protein
MAARVKVHSRECAVAALRGAFNASKLNRLLEYSPIAGARADRVDERMIEEYIVARKAVRQR